MITIKNKLYLNTDDLLSNIESFCNEYKEVTYDRDKSLEYLNRLIESDEVEIYTAYVGDKVAGLSIVTYSDEWHLERFGYMIKFYVMPEFRGTAVGRALMLHTAAWFDFVSCKKSFLTSTGGVGEDQQFINLVSKFGYKFCGQALERGNYK